MIEARVAVLRQALRGRPTYGPLRMALYRLAPSLMVCSDYLHGDLCGVYIDDVETIIIDRRLTLDVKRCVLVHELIHWAYGDAGICEGKEERRTRNIAARALIDEAAYRSAEIMYEGCGAMIAEELGVTQEVVADYRDYLARTLIFEGREKWQDSKTSLFGSGGGCG